MIEDIAVVNGVVVYCGSSLGSDRRFAEAARQVGREIARRGLPLVYGGGFYDGFLSQIGTAVSQGFLRRGEEDLFRVVVSGVDAVDFVAGGC